jgi:hypothetical protein
MAQFLLIVLEGLEELMVAVVEEEVITETLLEDKVVSEQFVLYGLVTHVHFHQLV